MKWKGLEFRRALKQTGLWDARCIKIVINAMDRRTDRQQHGKAYEENLAHKAGRGSLLLGLRGRGRFPVLKAVLSPGQQ